MTPSAQTDPKGAGGRQPLVPRPRHGGFILIAVLVVVMLASMVVVSLLFRLRAEETATAAGAGLEQAWAAAMSGVYEAMRVAGKASPGSLDWQEDTADFRERLVCDDGADRWFFSVFSRPDSDREEIRFGLTDEASKLNINQATEEMLEKLPKITPYLVQGLLDFLDSDNTPRPEGAEQEYYSALPIPYAVLNAPLNTLDELLLVRGFTPALLYGEDANWNYQLDANEDDGDAQFPPDNKDGKLDCGLRQYVTVCSYDLDQTNDRTPRINLNDDQAELSPKDQTQPDELPQAAVEYIDALRRNKVKIEQPADLLEAEGKFKDASGKEVEMKSGVGKTELPLVLDRFTTETKQRLPGKIDVNTAPSEVLRVLPGVDEALADSIVSARRNLRVEQRRTPAWLYQEGLLDAAQFKKISPYVTARGFQYHFHVIGYGQPSGRFRVIEAMVDLAGPKPAITYLRDITRLGVPFKIDTVADPGDTSSEPGIEQARTARQKATHG